MITLRPYQREAADAVYAHLRGRDDNPCVVIPTAGGKTPVMARVCMDTAMRWGTRARREETFSFSSIQIGAFVSSEAEDCDAIAAGTRRRPGLLACFAIKRQQAPWRPSVAFLPRRICRTQRENSEVTFGVTVHGFCVKRGGVKAKAGR